MVLAVWVWVTMNHKNIVHALVLVARGASACYVQYRWAHHAPCTPHSKRRYRRKMEGFWKLRLLPWFFSTLVSFPWSEARRPTLRWRDACSLLASWCVVLYAPSLAAKAGGVWRWLVAGTMDARAADGRGAKSGRCFLQCEPRGSAGCPTAHPTPHHLYLSCHTPGPPSTRGGGA